MTAAELLAQMRGIQSPAEQIDPPVLVLGFGPLVVGLIFAVLVAMALWRRTTAWRRQAVQELHAIEAQANDGNATSTREAWQRLAVLLRRLAIHCSRHPQVANLTGPAWLRMLDELFEVQCFESGPGRALIERPYQDRVASGDHDLAAVVQMLKPAFARLRTRHAVVPGAMTRSLVRTGND